MSELTAEFLRLLRDCRVRAVAWDWDRTAIRFHSGGLLSGRPAEQDAALQLGMVSDFRETCLALLEAGVYQAIATFSDAQMRNMPTQKSGRSGRWGFDRAPSHSHPPLAGEAMVRRGFEVNMGSPLEAVDVYAMYPALYQKQSDWESAGMTQAPPMSKEWHLEQIGAKAGVSLPEICLIDDDFKNIRAARSSGCVGIFVPGDNGFELQDAISQLKAKAP
eukprot:CAMPEP_0198336686 /NCGR_PEP_ID=MMETSP1450-20131203/21127_1 /TAXON_ID=753684 ORGANISM="Madagascaria erythrocladiodes, Strain CCMP3234" /NCGR_SAMPLE_ID=MMETSP1450 /ASSEMBLY_ACC=CAM_ASM_001115 /LENGTH=218 /DNA_ID=CAMNT_0044041443 /DNA_START=2317 /DNA_END=2970 /DNA_ORIENTATION=+